MATTVKQYVISDAARGHIVNGLYASLREIDEAVRLARKVHNEEAAQLLLKQAQEIGNVIDEMREERCTDAGCHGECRTPAHTDAREV